LQGVCIVTVCVEGLMAYHATFIVAIALQVLGLDAVGASSFVTGTGLSYIVTLLLMGGPAGRFGVRNSFLLGFDLIMAALPVLGSASELRRPCRSHTPRRSAVRSDRARCLASSWR
jgi:hypothetical protein